MTDYRIENGKIVKNTPVEEKLEVVRTDALPPAGYVMKTQATIGGETKVIDSSGKVLSTTPGTVPGTYRSRSSGGSSSSLNVVSNQDSVKPIEPKPPIGKLYEIKSVENNKPYDTSRSLSQRELEATAPSIEKSRQILGEQLGYTATAASFLIPGSLIFQGASKVPLIGGALLGLGQAGKINLFGKSLYQPGLVQQGVRAGEQIASKGGAFVFETLAPQVGKALSSPIGKVAVEVGKGVAVTTAGVTAAKGGYDVLNPTNELTEEEKKEFIKEAEKRTEQRITNEGLDIPFVDSTIEKGFTANMLGSTAYAFPGGRLGMIPTFSEEYKGVLAERKSNLSEEQRNKIAEKQLGKELYVGSVAELATLGYSSQKIGEGIGRPTAQMVGNFLGAGTKTMTKSVATGVAGVSGLIGGLVGGMAEGAVVYPAQQTSRYKEIKPEDWVGTTLFSGAFAGGGGALIGAGSVAFPTATKVVYNVAGALELGGEQYGDYRINKVAGNAFDLILNVGEKGTKVKTGVIVPIGTKTPTANLNTSTQGFVAGNLNPNIANPVGILVETPNPNVVPNKTPTVRKEQGFVPNPNNTQNVIENLVVEPNPDVPVENKNQVNVNTITYSIVPTPTSTYIPTYAGRHIPFIPPISGGGDWGHKASKRERTRFIDEFTMAFSGLAVPAQPTYFGKKSSAALTREFYKPRKVKGKKIKLRNVPRFVPGGANFSNIFV